MVLQQVALDAYQIAAHGHVAGLQLHADTGRFQGAAPFIHLREVIAQDGHIGHLAAGMETGQDREQTAASSQAGQTVHVRGTGSLQQGLAAQRGDGMVGHAVAQYNNVFHIASRF